MNTDDFVFSEKKINLMNAILLVHKKNLKVIKDGKNPHFNSNHATLPGVLEALREPLQEAGLVVVQMPLGGIDTCLLLTIVTHAASGEYIKWVYASPVAKKDPQGFGSALTYAKRYTLVAFFGLPEKDDDGNEASTEIYEAEDNQRAIVRSEAKKHGVIADEALKKISEYLFGIPMNEVPKKIKHYVDKNK